MAPQTIDLLFEQSTLSLEEVADRAGLTLDRVAAIVEGRWLPSPEEREQMARALGLDQAQVVWGHIMAPRNARYHQFGLPTGF